MKKIIIFAISGIGNAILFTPTLIQIKKKMPDAKITFFAKNKAITDILYGSKYYPYLNQFILAGYDTSPHAYSFDPMGAFDEEKEFTSTGSGSPFAYGVLEHGYKPGMSVEESIKLVIGALKAAVERDIASGGKGFRVAIIDKDGFKELTDAEIKRHM